MKKVTRIKQAENERSFSIYLEDNTSLVFKMHGNRANVILMNDQPTAIFRNHLISDFELRCESLDRTIDWTKDFFMARQDTLRQHYFTLGKEVWTYLNQRGFETADPETRWKLIQEAKVLLENPKYLICMKEEKMVLSLVPVGKIINAFSEPIAAINEFSLSASFSSALHQEKHQALKKLHARLESGKQYINKNEEKLNEILSDSHYQAWGDLIMANMGLIQLGMEKITVEDLYHDSRPVEIKLKKDSTPQKNAEIYYRKAKNQQIEIQKLRDSILMKQKEIGSTEKEIAAIAGEEDLKSVRSLIDETGILKSQTEKHKDPVPYREFEFMGFRIWVGKNADANDELTLKYSFKDDLWLHAKDVAGSHVLIKYQSGKIFPKDVIERAAQLAAHYSKRKNESLCPVAVTPKKFVRKRKGDPAGTMVVERENVVMIQPKG